MFRVTRRIPLCLFAIALLLGPARGQGQVPAAYTIATLAGDGKADFGGDGSQATAAQLDNPFGIALDGSGNLYIADQFNNRIRKVAPDGTISTVAGTGTAGYSGDNGAAAGALLNHPCGVAVDSSGNIYIADTANHVVRKISTSGTITTVAGVGFAGFNSDGTAVEALLATPMGLAFDAQGVLYIADSRNHRVRKLTSDGKLTTIAGSGAEGSLGDGGKATEASLNRPQGVAVDSSGSVYIADTFNSLLRKVDAGGTISRVAGNGIAAYSGDGGPAKEAALNYPKGVAADPGGNLYIVDSFNARIRQVTPDGKIRTPAGSGLFGDEGDGGAAVLARLSYPSSLTRDAAGNIFVADTQNNRVRLLTPTQQAAGDAPAIAARGVVSASTFGAFTSIAPGSWIEIHGANLASISRAWTAADFQGLRAPTSLEGTRVTIGGVDAFLSYVSPAQVNAQVPSNVPVGIQQLTLTTAAGTSRPHSVAVNPAQQGMFAPPAFRVGGRQYVAALSGDGTEFLLPSGSVAGVNARPARPGETIVIYAVGGGPVTPDIEAGELVQEPNTVSLAAEILFGQTPAKVVYAGLSPGAIGLYQFNVVVPEIPASDEVPLTITLGGVSAGQTLYIAVR